MSKKNDLQRRKKVHEYDLKREKEEREKRERKLQAKKQKMKIDGQEKLKKKNKRRGFKVGKKVTALVKAKAAQAMDIDK